MLDSAHARGAREILFLFWLFRRAQITLSPPGMRLPFSGIAVGVTPKSFRFAGLSIPAANRRSDRHSDGRGGCYKKLLQQNQR